MQSLRSQLGPWHRASILRLVSPSEPLPIQGVTPIAENAKASPAAPIATPTGWKPAKNGIASISPSAPTASSEEPVAKTPIAIKSP